MQTYTIHAAKTHLSRLIQQAANGEPFIIAKAGKAGKPLVKVMPLDAPVGAQKRRLGCMAGEIKVPDHFDEMCREEIEKMFYGEA